MPRKRLYASDAERQRAFRERRALLLADPVAAAAQEVARLKAEQERQAARRLTRPARLRQVLGQVEALMVDYQAKLENLPESLQESSTAEKLQETVDALEDVRDRLEGIDPPRWFGRD